MFVMTVFAQRLGRLQGCVIDKMPVSSKNEGIFRGNNMLKANEGTGFKFTYRVNECHDEDMNQKIRVFNAVVDGWDFYHVDRLKWVGREDLLAMYNAQKKFRYKRYPV